MVRAFIATFFIVTFLGAKTYQTYFPWEIDSIFVAFLIKQKIDKEAYFIAKDKNSTTFKNPINTKNSSLKRDARFSALEVAMHRFKINEDRCLKKLRRVVKIVEFSPWKKPLYPKIMKFETKLLELMPKKNQKSDLKEAFNYIKSFCEEK